MIAAALAILTALGLGWRLGIQSLADFDEAIYAEIAREMTRDGSLVVLHFNYAPWYQKPPLLMWGQALLFQTFGASDTLARVPSVLAGAATVALSYLIARRFLEWQGALLSVLVLLACYQFAFAGRFATTDMLLTLFIYLQVWAYLATAERPRAWYLVGLAAGLGIMTKGAAGLAGPLVIVVALAADRRLGAGLRGRSLWVGVVIALAVSLPWHLASTVLGGQAFLGDYVGYHLIRRSAQPIEGHQGNALTYLAVIRNGFFPWAYLALFALPLAAWRWYRHRDGSGVLLATIAVILVLYTLVQTKLTWYILPVYPALAVLGGGLLWKAATGERRELLMVAGAGILGALAIPLQYVTYPRWWAFAFLTLLAIAGGGFLTSSRPAPALVALVVVFFGAISVQRDAQLYRHNTAPVVAVAMAAHDGSGRPLGVLINDPAILDTPVWPDVLWYADRPLVTAKGSAPIPGVTDYLLGRADAAGFRSVFQNGPYEYASTSS